MGCIVLNCPKTCRNPFCIRHWRMLPGMMRRDIAIERRNNELLQHAVAIIMEKESVNAV